MPVTGQLGSVLSQPGGVQLGFVFEGTAVWRGPFNPGQVTALPVTIAVDGNASVAPAIASQLASADVHWWDFH